MRVGRVEVDVRRAEPRFRPKNKKGKAYITDACALKVRRRTAAAAGGGGELDNGCTGAADLRLAVKLGNVLRPMRHIIAILLQNEAGALARVAGMFSTRGYNIDSLSVAPTHDPAVSRLTLVTHGSEEVVGQIIQQTRKLIDVVDIVDLLSRDHLECELALVKLAVDAGNSRAVVDCVRRYRGIILDESDNTRLIQLAGSGPEIDQFIAEVGAIAAVVELVRSGVAAVSRGADMLSSPV